jgi:hypothetical protein
LRSPGPNRITRRRLVLLVGGLLWGGSPHIGSDTALAKGPAPFGFEERYVVPGDIARGRFQLTEDSASADTYVRAYLVPLGAWLDDDRPYFLTVPLEEHVASGRPNVVRVRFTVPDVSSRSYRFVLCPEKGRCPRRVMDDLVGGRITVVEDRAQIPLWRRFNQLHRSVTGEVAYLRARVIAGRSWEVVQSGLARVSKDNEALRSTIRALRSRLQEIDRSPSPGALVAAGALGGLLAVVLLRVVQVRPVRRRGSGRTSGPATPAPPPRGRTPLHRTPRRTPVR